MHDSPNTQVVLKNMSKTNPVVLNGASIAGAAGVELNDGDEVVFPSAESERIGFKYRLVAKDTVEERILVLQEKKRAVADAALGEADGAAALTRDDLVALLEG